MDSMNLLPVDTGSGVGGSALGAFAGALFGSWFGDGGFGGRGAGAVAATTAAVDTGIVLDQLSNLNSSVNGLGLSVVQGQNSTNMAIVQSAVDTYTALNSTLNAQTLANQTASSTTNATLIQGFSGLNQSVYQGSVDTRFAINDLARQNAECCCEIKTAIGAEGAATRQLIQSQYINQLETQLCDAKSQISTLESNAFTVASNAQQTQILLAHLAQHK